MFQSFFISFRRLGLVIYYKNITCLLLRNILDELELGILKINNISIVIDSSGRFIDYHIVKTQTVYCKKRFNTIMRLTYCKDKSAYSWKLFNMIMSLAYCKIKYVYCNWYLAFYTWKTQTIYFWRMFSTIKSLAYLKT